MDLSRENLYTHGVSKELLDTINNIINKIGIPSILISSSQMSKVILQEGIEQIFKNKINFIHTLGSTLSYTSKSELELILNLAQNPDNILVIKKESFCLFTSHIAKVKLDKHNTNVCTIEQDLECIKIAKKKS